VVKLVRAYVDKTKTKTVVLVFIFTTFERDSPKAIPAERFLTVHFLCLPKENEPKEKVLFHYVFFKITHFKKPSLWLNYLQGFDNY
jgi:hypothetical protein